MKSTVRFQTLSDWLSWQETLHPNAIDMGLERVQAVLERLKLAVPPYRVLTIGGTNGKGSCVAFVAAILSAQGYRVGAYTSPHLVRYNERVSVSGKQVEDAEFCDAFARIDAARGDISLTYFEFGTLAALDIFQRHRVEVAVLEVGMGGRLDAVNAVEPDGALVASVGLDHQEWLGNDRDSIGFEKAGIYRGHRPAICGDRQPPPRLIEVARQKGAELLILGRDFDWSSSGREWSWQSGTQRIADLPSPALQGRIQYDNAASAIALLQAVPALKVSGEAMRRGVASATLPARFERIRRNAELVFDVAHNPDAAGVLAANLEANPVTGKTLAVLGMFRDKAVESVAMRLAPQVDRWFLAALAGPRGQTAAQLAARVTKAVPQAVLSQHGNVNGAFDAACAQAGEGDRIVVCGSFQTVSEVLQHGGANGLT